MRQPFQLKIPNEVRDILETELKSIPEAEMKGHLWPSDVPQKHSKIYSQSKEMGGVHISSCIFFQTPSESSTFPQEKRSKRKRTEWLPQSHRPTTNKVAGCRCSCCV